MGETAREAMDRLRAELKAELVRQGLNQADLAKVVGGNQSDVSQFLRGRWPDMRILTLFRYATGMGLQVEISLKRKPR